MTTRLFEDMSTGLAYAGIHEFFTFFGLGGARYDIESILIAAGDNTTWKKEVPSNLLYCMQKLEELSASAFVIYYSLSTRDECILEETETGSPDMTRYQEFARRNANANVWDYFPRNLTERQYYNPYRAIRKFCTAMAEPEWKKVLKEVTEFALSNNRIDEIDPTYNMLTVRKRLLQMIEACYLLDVRSNIEKVPDTQKQKTKAVKK